MQKTKSIAGRKISLQSGKTYLATRPMAQRFSKLFPVTINALISGNRLPVMTIPALSYDEANRFLAAFNNRKSSFDGRAW